MREHNIAVLVVVHELVEIRLLSLLENAESHEVGNTVAANRHEEEMTVLQFHLIPLAAHVQIVACKHLANLPDVVILDGNVGHEISVVLRQTLRRQRQQTVELIQVGIRLPSVLLQFGIKQQVGNLNQRSPVMMFQCPNLNLDAAVVAVLQHRIDVYRAISALLGFLDIVVNSPLDDERQSVLVAHQSVIQFVGLLRR